MAMWHRTLVALIALLVGAFACRISSAQAGDAGPLSGVRSWGYQLQHPDPEVLAASPYDLVVIDYSRDGTDAGALTVADLARIKKKPDGSRRIVLAYMSIGEAETYRYYWRWTWGGHWYTDWLSYLLAPSWLGKQNEEWGGNYAVRYWDDGWQRVILGDGGYLDRIVAAGFDGVWLDKIDSSIEAIASKRSSAKTDMRMFVARIAERGRRAKPGFLVVPQNGEELLTDAAYRSMIDGLGKEDLLYGEFKEKQANPPDVVKKRVDLLSLLTAERKPVLAVEYLDAAAEIKAASAKLKGFGFIPHFADRALDSLRIGELPSSTKGRSKEADE